MIDDDFLDVIVNSLVPKAKKKADKRTPASMSVNQETIDELADVVHGRPRRGQRPKDYKQKVRLVPYRGHR